MWVIEGQSQQLLGVMRAPMPFTDKNGTQHPKDVLTLWTAEELAAIGVMPLTPVPRPSDDDFIVEGSTATRQPDGSWLQEWQTVPMPADRRARKLLNVRLDKLAEVGVELDRRLDAAEDRAAFEQNRELALAGLLSRKTFDQTQWPQPLATARADYLAAVQNYATIFSKAKALRQTIKAADLPALRALDVTADQHWQ